MAKAVQMQTFALANTMRPNDKITRQEAFAVLSRAFKTAVTDSDYTALNAFSDKGSISSWALADLTGLKEAGYIEGSNGKLNPLGYITRAEFATVMNKLVKQYIDTAGTVNTVVTGNVMIRQSGVTLQNLTIKGDLIIADGVGEGDATLDNVKVEGRTVVRGGGVNSFIIKGNSDLGKVIVSKVDGKVSIKVQGGADVEVIFIDDGSDDVNVEGTIGTLEVAGDEVTVTATGATVTSAIVSGTESKIVVGTGSTIKTGTISGDSSGIVVNTGGTVTTLTVSGENASVTGTGTVTTISVTATAENAQVSTPNTTVTVATGATGVVVGGEAVTGGSTATTNATGTDATVTETPTTSDGGGGGGGGVLTPVLSISSVKHGLTTISPVDGVYTIPTGADSGNTSIAVAISNYSNVAHSVSLQIKNGSNQTVASVNGTNISYNAIALLNGRTVTFDNFFTMLDQLADEEDGYYLAANGNHTVVGAAEDENAFQDAIDGMFARMSGGNETYTINVALTPTGGSAGTAAVLVKKEVL